VFDDDDDPSCYAIFFVIISQTSRFRNEDWREMCILVFPTTVICNFISGINQRDIVKAHRFLCKVPDIFFWV
jgi:hypothetical protein